MYPSKLIKNLLNTSAPRQTKYKVAQQTPRQQFFRVGNQKYEYLSLRQPIIIIVLVKGTSMSFFLLQVNGWSQNGGFQQRRGDRAKRGACRAQQAQQKFDACMRKNIKKHQEFTQTMTAQDGNSKAYGLLFQNISLHFKGLLSFIYSKRTQQVSVAFNFLNKGDDFIRLDSKQALVEFYRTILLAPESQHSMIKLVLGQYNCSISLKIAYFSFSHSNILQDLAQSEHFQSRNLILEIYKKYFEPFIPLFDKALAQLKPIERLPDAPEQSRLLTNIYRYTKMMTVRTYLNSETLVSQEAREKQLKKREDNSMKLLMNQQSLDVGMAKPAELFLDLRSRATQKKYPKHEFHISEMEEKSLVGVITTDSSVPKEPNSSAHILNFIHIYQPAKLELFPFNYGGFSVLETAEINFWYVQSFNASDNKNLKPENKVTRYMAIKKDNKPHGKALHQSKILMEMRHGVNNLLPKYFIPVNMPGYDPNVNPLLMMELFTEGNLVEYLRFRYPFLSLLSKVYLMFSITLALRHLETYKIVHLDLKPNNIMLAPGLVIKLIDFGEAFHPEVCRNPNHRYRPGFTLPYSPPQFRLGLKYGFTSKSDVFSLGILMFEIIYGKVPFETRQKLFLAAEGCDVYGDPVVIRILNWIISRCLSKNPDIRPQLDWIAIILRLCLDLVI